MSAPEVIVVLDEAGTTMRMTVALAKMHYNVTAVPAERPIAAALRLAGHAPAAIVVKLAGNENVMELRTLLSASEQTRFVLLMPEMPPSAAVARIAALHGAVTLDGDASPVVVGATLVTLLLAQERKAEEHG